MKDMRFVPRLPDLRKTVTDFSVSQGRHGYAVPPFLRLKGTRADRVVGTGGAAVTTSAAWAIATLKVPSPTCRFSDIKLTL